MRQEILRKRVLYNAIKDKVELKKQRKPIIRKRTRMTIVLPVTEERKADEEEEVIAKTKAPIVISKRVVRKPRQVCAVKVCKPEICCADLEGKQLPSRSGDEAIYFFAFQIAEHSVSHVDGPDALSMSKITRSPFQVWRDPITPVTSPRVVRFHSARGIM